MSSSFSFRRVDRGASVAKHSIPVATGKERVNAWNVFGKRPLRVGVSCADL